MKTARETNVRNNASISNSNNTLQYLEERFHQRYLDNLKDALESRERNLQTTRNTFLFVFEANSLGLKISPPTGMWDALEPSTILVEDMKDFSKIHKIVGALKHDGVVKADDDARKRLAWKYLRPVSEQFKHLRFKYKTRLPKESKCRIVRVKQKATKSYWVTTVVCDKE